tara:strand:- start:2596 stop:2838 length:243 start_codon:yes stop_codon:yes gene_type:complete
MRLHEIGGGIPGATPPGQETTAPQTNGSTVGAPTDPNAQAQLNPAAAKKQQQDQKKTIQAQIKSTQAQLKGLQQQLASIR